MKKLKKLSLLFLPILAVVAFIADPDLYRSFGPLIIGGVITGGILGGFSGKVGAVVGGKWKNTDYMRGYVIPANPNSNGQKNQRGKMGRMVSIGKQLLSTIIHPYWDPFFSSMSGYNSFVKTNISNLANAVFDVNGIPISPSFDLDENFVMAQGSLTPITGLVATYTALTGALVLTWTDNSGVGDALGTDSIVAIAIGTDGLLFDIDESTTRSAGTVTLTLPTNLTASANVAFVFAKAGTGSALKVSNSLGSIAVV